MRSLCLDTKNALTSAKSQMQALPFQTNSLIIATGPGCSPAAAAFKPKPG